MDDQRADTAAEQAGEDRSNLFHLLAQATTLSWNLVVPVVGGALLGRYLDDLFDKDFTWTLSLLGLGVLVAFNNLYAMYVEHGGTGSPNKQEQGTQTEGESDGASE